MKASLLCGDPTRPRAHIASISGKAGFLLLCLPLVLVADQLRFDTAGDWRQWQLPLGAVELNPDGTIAPVRIRKQINAALDAADFGGGIRAVGSNRAEAPLVMDGDLATGWSPDPEAEPGDGFIEIDLGRGVSVDRVTLIFAEEAPPFELFDLLLSTGEPAVDNVGNPVAGTLVYRIRERYKENRRHRIVYELDRPLIHTPFQVLRIETLTRVPGARLMEVEFAAIGDNLALDLLEKGGGIDIILNVNETAEEIALGNALSLVDGNLFQRWRNHREPRAPYDVWSHITIDLGAVYWTDLVRLIGGVVVRSGGGGGITTAHYVSRREFNLKTYEVMTSDGALAPDGTRVWTKHFSGAATDEFRRLGMADHHFERLPTRYVRIAWLIWDAACAAALSTNTNWACYASATSEEIQIFGAGYPREVRLRSPLLDLGSSRNLNAVQWQAVTPPGTRVEIRTRTGSEVEEQLTFYDKNGKEVTQKRWEKLIPSFRGPIDTTLAVGGDWSPWSKLYAFSGQEFQSPSPRHYMEMEVKLISVARDEAATLDWLAVDFSPPLASRTAGEIYPLEVRPGESTEFSYYLRPIQTQSGGFDRLTVVASTPLNFMAAVLDDEEVETRVEARDSGFRITFPRPIRSDQLVELRFESSIFLQSTRFDVFLEDSRQGDSVRQRVDPGDATDAVESSTNIVNLPVSRDLFANVIPNARVITPNGDGVNDALAVAFDLVNVLEPRPLCLRLFDLAGRLLHEQEEEATAGEQLVTWDGRDIAGQLVAPGIYVLELQVAGDTREEAVRRLVSVVY